MKSTMKSICRICLCFRDCTKMLPLADRKSDSGLSSYGEMAKKLTNVSFPYNTKDLPMSMCEKCLNLLQHRAMSFKKMCLQSDKIIRNLNCYCLSRNANLRNALTEFVMFKTIIPEVLPDSYIDAKSDTDHLKVYEFDTADTPSCSLLTPECLIQNKEVSNDTAFTFSREQESHSELRSYSNEHQDKCDIKNPSNVDKMEKFSETKPSKLSFFMLKEENSKTKRIRRRRKVKTAAVKCFCEMCGKVFSSIGALRIHQLRVHDVGEKLVCNECGHKVPDKQEMIIHLRRHTGERPYSCDKCDMTFHRRYTWKQHALFHQEKKFQCPNCPRRFYRRPDMISHYNTHDRLHVYQCPICFIQTSGLKSVKLHIVRRHGIPAKDQGKLVKTIFKETPRQLLEIKPENESV